MTDQDRVDRIKWNFVQGTECISQTAKVIFTAKLQLPVEMVKQDPSSAPLSKEQPMCSIVSANGSMFVAFL